MLTNRVELQTCRLSKGVGVGYQFSKSYANVICGMVPVVTTATTAPAARATAGPEGMNAANEMAQRVDKPISNTTLTLIRV